jgi:hypothetical protein
MWRSILSNRWRVRQDFSASCNNSLISVERVCSSTPGSNGSKRFRFSLGTKLSTGRPSYGPSPTFIMHSWGGFLQVCSVSSFNRLHRIWRARIRIKSGELSDGIRKCTNGPQVVHSELLFFLRTASNLKLWASTKSASSLPRAVVRGPKPNRSCARFRRRKTR